MYLVDNVCLLPFFSLFRFPFFSFFFPILLHLNLFLFTVSTVYRYFGSTIVGAVQVESAVMSP